MNLQRGVHFFIVVLVLCLGLFIAIAWADSTINATGQTTLVPTLTQTPLGLSVMTLIPATPTPAPVLPAGTSGSTDGSYSSPSTGSEGTDTGSPEVHPLMHFTKDQMDEMQNEIALSPKYSAPERLFSQTDLYTSSPKSLLSYVPYTPSQRNQGQCGDCWVWASTGALEVDHNVNYGISDRLSIQYFNSKYNSGTGSGMACCGGNLQYFTTWYNSDKTPIPWSNTNAAFGDSSTSCDSGTATTAVPISSISTSPNYHLNSISSATIPTYGQSNTTAISNIESALDSNKAVVYLFWLNSTGWSGTNGFFNFWGYGASTSMFDPSIYTSGSSAGGHAVLIVGYDTTTDPNNPYWIVLNSWGAPSNRPDGLFRLNMTMNYNATVGAYQQNVFQIVNSGFSAVPAVTGISPTSGTAAGGTTVTITGNGFTGANTVKFGSTANATGAMTVNSDTRITVTSPAHAAGTFDVTVTNITSGTSPVSANDKFTYIGIPVVTGISPPAGLLAGGNSITITGTNFTGANAVTFGTTAATTYTVNSATQITATSPAGSGTVDVTVTNTTSGTSATSSADQYTYIAAPAVTGILPINGPAAGGTSVTITGTNLGSATAVKFGSTPASVTADTATSVTATSPAGTGSVDVTVTTAGGTSPTSANDKFTYIGIPVVTGISPPSGPAAGGTPVTITGTNFTGANTVKFGVTANVTGAMTVNSDTQISVTSPAHAAGPVDVTVTNITGGTSPISANDKFTYIGIPVVTGISPGSGPAAGGTPVTVTGTNLTGANTVTFGSTAATTYTVNSATQITATSPAGSVGTVDVTVTNTTGGTSAISSADKFTYIGIPVVTGISPASGPAVGGMPVTITGTNFTGANTVKFGGTANATGAMTVNSPTQITATSPVGLGTVDVTVTNITGGTSPVSANDKFTYIGIPVVTGISPPSGQAAGGTTVTITGTNLTGANAVMFGSTAATPYTVNSDTQITATSPAGSGIVDITVTNTTGGTSPTSMADHFKYGIEKEVGIYKDGVWYLDYNKNGVWDGATDDRNYNFGGPGNVSVVGDWNGDGKTEIGVTNGIDWYLDTNGNGVWDGTGPAGDQYEFFGIPPIYKPIVGDWNGDGKTEIGVTNGIDWYLDTNGNGVWDGTGPGGDQHGYFGIPPTYISIVGDWNGDGKDKIGVTNGTDWYLDTNGNGVWDGTGPGGDQHDYFSMGPGYTPIVGDWNGDGKTEIGLTNGIDWYLDANGNGVWDGTGPGGDQYGFFGIPPSYIPIVGDWNGDGKDKIGVTNDVNWYLDANGNGVWDGIPTDKAPFFGITGWTPVIGKWQ